jgi:hypothetical protein
MKMDFIFSEKKLFFDAFSILTFWQKSFSFSAKKNDFEVVVVLPEFSKK